MEQDIETGMMEEFTSVNFMMDNYVVKAPLLGQTTQNTSDDGRTTNRMEEESKLSQMVIPIRVILWMVSAKVKER